MLFRSNSGHALPKTVISGSRCFRYSACIPLPTVPTVPMIPTLLFLVWAAATFAPGSITPMMGMSNSSLTASKAKALAVLHAEYLKHLDPEITVFGKACPLFVPLVKEGWLHDPVTDEVAARYLKELQDKQVDSPDILRLP